MRPFPGIPNALWPLLLLLPLAACRQPTGETNTGARSPFFDLRQFFTDEIERLQQARPAVRKTVRIDDRTETRTTDSLDYRDELHIFLNADINRTAWWDKYAIDSTRANGALRGIHYQAREPDLPIRDIRIELDAGGRVTRVAIVRDTDSPAAKMHQELRYDPAEGYSLLIRQNVAFSKPREMNVEVSFLK